MVKLIVLFVFVIYCGAMMRAPGGGAGPGAGAVPGGAVAIVVHGEAGKLWDDNQLIEIMQLKSTLANYSTIEDGSLPVLEENPMLSVKNLELIK
ncbi:hypothetical protein LOAG_10506 [Loa loa]|uniref:Secreted protein n=1 Tax=Loa loa TaxID=7209 RepID=A0A1I7V8B0_LOALO|nr:hypothetical protein LOAG_10506 [Loa loa]EFO17990.1 hypothetical protein LOAG_10506 [Loa loa]